MYLDYILFAASGAFLLAALLLTIHLLRSRKKSRDYRRLLSEETERLDVITALRQSRAQKPESAGEKPLMESRALTETGTVTETGTLLEGGAAAAGAKPETASMVKTELMPETELIPETESVRGTELIPETGGPLPTKPQLESQPGAGLDLSPLEGKYELLREIHGGGMSRVFLARNVKLGSDWIVKFVERAELAGEAEVLKKLNHISLPPIVDILSSRQGTFLVERYIEGCPLSEVLSLNQEIRESQICDWGLQLAQVLSYLHTLPAPIFHCDLKPSNIMVTYDNRLVLIDFGISKQQGTGGGASGITYRYAAPEQFRGTANRPEIIGKYFGSLPPEHERWAIDARTDLYSAGVILRELTAGTHPSPELSKVIARCLEIDPEKRYPSAKALAEAMETIRGRQASMARSLVLRRVAAACCGLCLAGSLVTSASGAYVNRMETLSIVTMDPGRVLLTVQQSVQLLVQKTAPDGRKRLLEPEKIDWSYSQDNIARLDGDRLVGLNVGETTLYGTYRNKIITLEVTVAEPPEETTAVALRYAEGIETRVYAGTGRRSHEDGDLRSASFVSPESMAADGDRLCLSDSGVIRILENGEAGTLSLEPDYLTADLVRTWEGDLYVLTGPWTAEDGGWYGFLRIGKRGAELLYRTEAAYSTVTDFAFSSGGTLWFIQQNPALGSTSLNRLEPDSGETAWVMDLPESARCMAFDEADNLYISVPEQGLILRAGAGESGWTYFAGVDGKRNFIDGAIPNFYYPTALAARDGVLYVLDFDTVRSVAVEGAGALFTETLAGVPEADTNPEVLLGPGGQSVLPASQRAFLAFDGAGRLLLSGPKNAVIYEIGLPRHALSEA